jgi:ketosteroid isomerase-like protein
MSTLENMVREYLAAFEDRDVEKILSFFAPDATWITPAGTFRGTAELRRYLTAETQMLPSVKVTETGMGLVAQGNRVAIEHEIEGPVQGKMCTWLAMCAYEFNDGKIQRLSTVYDRLSILQDAADGWLQKRLVNAMVNQAEHGLH